MTTDDAPDPEADREPEAAADAAAARHDAGDAGLAPPAAQAPAADASVSGYPEMGAAEDGPRAPHHAPEVSSALAAASLAGPDDGTRSVMERIADAAIARYERLPMLDVVFERVVRQFTERLMQLMSANAEATLQGIDSGRFGDFTAQIQPPCLVAVIRAPGWGGECLVAVDQRMIYDMVEILLGGERAATPDQRQVRQPTPIERRLTQRVFATFAEVLKLSFGPLRPTEFEIDRVESSPHFAMIARASAAAVEARIGLEVAGAHGELHLIIPYTTLEPVRPQLRQMFMGEKFGRDETWDAHMRGRVAAAPVRVTAQLEAGRMPLSHVMAWRAGDVLALPDLGARPRAVLECQGRRLGEGPVGARNGRVAVRLETGPEGDPACVGHGGGHGAGA